MVFVNGECGEGNTVLLMRFELGESLNSWKSHGFGLGDDSIM